MAEYIVEGGNSLSGNVRISGAKNSALPILAASLMIGDEVCIKNCPDLSDVDATVNILLLLGCRVKREGSTLVINSLGASFKEIPEPLMREMRSSIIFLGALISRYNEARLSMPGGCELGPRPIDLHMFALRLMGVSVTDNCGVLECKAEKGLCGSKISLRFPSVGATENIMLAAVCARGTTEIYNAAKEPEIVDLAGFLNACGARIYNAGNSTITIEGVPRLHGCEYSVMPDRIETATFMSATALTQGNIILENVSIHDLRSILPTFEELGCEMKSSADRLKISMNKRPNRLKNLVTMPHPGFPTDAQAAVMAVTTVANGTSVFIENIFENRYKHAYELVRMGADIQISGRAAVVQGVKKLHGATVQSTDLRSGAALCIAALNAEGITTIGEIHHIARGYENFEGKLKALGANIRKGNAGGQTKQTGLY